MLEKPETECGIYTLMPHQIKTCLEFPSSFWASRKRQIMAVQPYECAMEPKPRSLLYSLYSGAILDSICVIISAVEASFTGWGQWLNTLDCRKVI